MPANSSSPGRMERLTGMLTARFSDSTLDGMTTSNLVPVVGTKPLPNWEKIYPLQPGPDFVAPSDYWDDFQAAGYEVADVLKFPPLPHLNAGQRRTYNYGVAILERYVDMYGAENVVCMQADMPLGVESYMVINDATRVAPGTTALLIRIAEQAASAEAAA